MKIGGFICFVLGLKLIYAVSSAVVPHIIEFDDSNIELTLEKSRYSFIYFFSDVCGYCEKFNPDFENLSLLYNHNASSSAVVQIIKTNARANQRLSGLFSIHRYPSLRLLDFDTKEIITYDKDKRDLPSLIEFIQERVADATPDYNKFQSNIQYLDDTSFVTAESEPHNLVVFTLSFLPAWKNYHYPNHAYQKLSHAEAFNHIKFNLVDVDNVQIQETLAKYHISNFPSVIYFHRKNRFKIYNSYSQNHVTRNNLDTADIETFLSNLHSEDQQYGIWYDSVSALVSDIQTTMKQTSSHQYGKKGFNINQGSSQNIIQSEQDIDDEYSAAINHIEL